MSNEEASPKKDFIREIVAADLSAGKHERIVTRFPPEPSGYLHIGHAKAFCLDFGIAFEFGGHCNLRFDDTNPMKEETEFVDSIMEDIRWLGFDWGEKALYASDYFEELHDWAVKLIRDGNAYVDDLSADEIREMRGTLTEPGTPSPHRDRSVEENLDLFARMRAGEFENGTHVLRAKIDMASPNFALRDPVMYRIQHAEHHRTGDAWCIYPMYDWAHGQSDAIEGVTHSLCSLEFENNRPLYDWFLDRLDLPERPRQYEFARLNMTHTVMSKRKLRRLVEEGHVDGWDDPRMPTLAALRRRGYTPEAIREFVSRVGVTKSDNVIDIALLEHCLREDLNRRAPRFMAVTKPLKVVILNYPEGETEEFDFVNNPEDESAGTRKVPFGREVWIERDDFMEEPVRKFFRLAPGREVRLRYAYLITCEHVVKDPATGEITELHCTYDPESRGGNAPDGRKVKATLHWVSAAHARDATVRLYDALFTREDPEAGGEDFVGFVNPDSLTVLPGAKVEPALAGLEAGVPCQFERQGYFCRDTRDGTPEAPVFNRAVSLRDTWAKLQKQQNRQ
ncbi:MAG: glutamine--tRNA ligase/YqeY domain fusion protein [Planctomycetota bacterium]